MKKLLLCCALLSGIMVMAEFPVVPRQRYRIEFEAAATGKVLPEEWQEQGVRLPTPRVILMFYNGKKIVRNLNRSDVWVVSEKNFTKGWFDVYAPDRAQTVLLRVRDAKVRNVKITKVSPGKVVSVPMHYRRIGAFTPGTRFTILDRAKGTALYDTSKSGFYGDIIPVNPGERYLLTVKGGNGWRSENVVRYHFYAHSNAGYHSCGGNKEALRVSNSRPVLKYEIMVPAKAKWMRFYCMWGTLLDYSFEKLDK